MDSHIARLFVVADIETVTCKEFGFLEFHIDVESGIRSLCPWIEHHQYDIVSCGTCIDKRIGSVHIDRNELGVVGECRFTMMQCDEFACLVKQ